MVVSDGESLNHIKWLIAIQTLHAALFHHTNWSHTSFMFLRNLLSHLQRLIPSAAPCKIIVCIVEILNCPLNEINYNNTSSSCITNTFDSFQIHNKCFAILLISERLSTGTSYMLAEELFTNILFMVFLFKLQHECILTQP